MSLNIHKQGFYIFLKLPCCLKLTILIQGWRGGGGNPLSNSKNVSLKLSVILILFLKDNLLKNMTTDTPTLKELRINHK